MLEARRAFLAHQRPRETNHPNLNLNPDQHQIQVCHTHNQLLTHPLTHSCTSTHTQYLYYSFTLTNTLH